MRRFALSTLRDFGMGKSVAQEKILEESCHLIQMFDEHKGTELSCVSDNNIAWCPDTYIVHYCAYVMVT